MKELTSFERVKLALQHKEGDKVPFDLGGCRQAIMHIKKYKELREYFNLDINNVKFNYQGTNIVNMIMQRAFIERDIKDLMSADIDGIYPNPPSEFICEESQKGDYMFLKDEFGVKWRKPKEDGLYYSIYEHPLKDAESVDDIKNYKLLDPADSERFKGFKDQIDRSVQDNRPVLINTYGAGIFELALFIRGYNEFFMDLIDNSKLAYTLLDKILEHKINYWDRVLKIVGDNTVILGECDDIGTQDNLMISPEMYRKYIKPYHKKLFEYIKRKATGKVYVFFHSCGSIYKLIPDFIEVGVDILNPVQYTASGMDLKRLKSDFGNDIVFWGGGIDSQGVLPKGTPEEVKDEVKRNIEILAPGGGFIFSSIHNIQSDVPIKNILAMRDALQEYGVY